MMKRHQKCKICGVLAENDAFDGGHQKNFFTPLQAHGVENFSAWRGRIFSLATQKTRQSWTNKHVPIKFYKISKYNSIFILLIQNKGVSL